MIQFMHTVDRFMVLMNSIETSILLVLVPELPADLTLNGYAA